MINMFSHEPKYDDSVVNFGQLEARKDDIRTPLGPPEVENAGESLTDPCCFTMEITLVIDQNFYKLQKT